MATLDELFGELEKARLEAVAKEETPEAIARREVKRKAEVEREIRQGLRDASGEWIDQPEQDEEEDEEEEE